MPIEEKIKQLKQNFDSLKTWEEKYQKMIDLGKSWPGLTDEFKVEDLKVKGCQSQVWIKAEMTVDKKIIFRGDSDALLVKGLVAIVLQVYSNETPQTILQTEPTFIKEIGFDSGLSPSRSNGLYSMIKQVKYYATAFQYLLSK